jgi:hypothetical protein
VAPPYNLQFVAASIRRPDSRNLSAQSQFASNLPVSFSVCFQMSQHVNW